MTRDDGGRHDDEDVEKGMTTDTANGNSAPGEFPPVDGYGIRGNSAERDEVRTCLSRDEWEAIESDPDPVEDLEYSVEEWEQYHTSDTTDQVIFLPEDESLLKEDSFLVAEENVLCDLGEHC